MELCKADNGKYFRGIYEGCFEDIEISGKIKKVNPNKVTVEVLTTIDGWNYSTLILSKFIHEV
ncbi:hypothetical protein KHQ82_05340 [Mycoplasmatota bacterium]|nr:hypothetical protein KHQ82_05340 [Mycoplasmatota bacterium]